MLVLGASIIEVRLKGIHAHARCEARRGSCWQRVRWANNIIAQGNGTIEENRARIGNFVGPFLRVTAPDFDVFGGKQIAHFTRDFHALDVTQKRAFQRLSRQLRARRLLRLSFDFKFDFAE